MELKRVTKDQLIKNEQNPRTISELKLGQLVESLLSFPEMLYIRPVVMGSEGISLGGNMRLQAIEEIRNYVQPRKVELRDEQRQKRTDAGLTIEQDEKFEDAMAHLLFDQDYIVIDVSFLSKEKQDEFIIKDNVSFGDWDWGAVEKLWGKEKVTSWGLDVPNWIEAKEETNDEKEYTEDDLPTEHTCPKCGFEFN